jgi:hypothetical protein
VPSDGGFQLPEPSRGLCLLLVENDVERRVVPSLFFGTGVSTCALHTVVVFSGIASRFEIAKREFNFGQMRMGMMM